MLVARRQVRMGGVSYQPGQPIRIEMTATKRRNLLRSGYADEDPGARYVACRAFQTLGRQYTPGDAIDLSGVSAHKRRTLIDQRFVAAAQSVTKPAPLIPVITKTGRGCYTVQLGDRIEKIRGEANAREMAALLAEEARR